MKTTRTLKHFSVRQNKTLVRFPLRNGRLGPPQIVDSETGTVLAQARYLLQFEQGSSQRTIRSAPHHVWTKHGAGGVLEIDCSIKGKLDISLTFVFAPQVTHLFELHIRASVPPKSVEPFAFRTLCIVPGQPTRHVRLCAGLYCGWTIAEKTFVVFPRPSEPRHTIAIINPADQVKLGAGEYRASGPVRCAPICFAYPPAIVHGRALLPAEVELKGAFAFTVNEQHIHNPVQHIRARCLADESRNLLPGRYALGQYCDRYLRFLAHPEMFVAMGRGYGLFHRGFFNCTPEGSAREKLPDQLDEKRYAGALLYRHWALQERDQDATRHPHLLRFGDYGNMCQPLCDVVWGGAHNLQTALFLYRHNALIPKARRIVRTLLHYRNREGDGFQIADGAVAGAWWNAYQPHMDVFSSRYFEPQVGVPDQGLWAYYLSRLHEERYCLDREIRTQVQHNCQRYLAPHLPETCLYPHVQTLGGDVGYTREKATYPRASPCASILAALGFVCGYRLTGQRRWKDLALKVARATVESCFSRYDWGWLEYDTLGSDTMGIARCLLALCELYREFPRRWLRDAARLTMAHLYAYQHHVDLDLQRYLDNGRSWGGASFNYGGFPHGHTYNSPQGLQTLTLRSDLSEGLLAYYDTFGDALAYESLVKYLNMLTYHQVIRRDIRFGFGSSSEHLNLVADYVQDTFQVSNAMPFGVERLLQGLYVGSANSAIKAISIGPDELEVRFEKTARLVFALEHRTATRYEVFPSGLPPIVSHTGSVLIRDYRGQTIRCSAPE